MRSSSPTRSRSRDGWRLRLGVLSGCVALAACGSRGASDTAAPCPDVCVIDSAITRTSHDLSSDVADCSSNTQEWATCTAMWSCDSDTYGPMISVSWTVYEGAWTTWYSVATGETIGRKTVSDSPAFCDQTSSVGWVGTPVCGKTSCSTYAPP